MFFFGTIDHSLSEWRASDPRDNSLRDRRALRVSNSSLRTLLIIEGCRTHLKSISRLNKVELEPQSEISDALAKKGLFYSMPWKIPQLKAGNKAPIKVSGRV